MKNSSTFLFVLITAVACFAADEAEEPTPIRAPGSLSSDRVEVIYLAPGRATTIQLHTKKKVQRTFTGDTIIDFRYDEKLNQIQVVPTVDEGETNLNVTIDGETYIFEFKIVNDRRVQYRVTYTLENDANAQEEADDAIIAQASPMKPTEVNIIDLFQTVDRARMDATFRQTMPMLRSSIIDKSYSWNDCLIRLVEVNQFLDKDLLLFKVEWQNRTQDAVRLHAAQYGLSIANRNIRILAATQDSPNAIIMPGQHEVVWLVVQGYKLKRSQNWELTLPPDATKLAQRGRAGGR